MSSRLDEDRRYAEYLASLLGALDLPGAQQAERDKVDRDSAAALDSALRIERDARDRVTAATRATDDAAHRVGRLVSRSGAQEEPEERITLPERLADFERAAGALLADVRSSETAWDWVERARQAPKSPPTQGFEPSPTGPAPAEPVQQAPASGGSGCGVMALAILANLGLLALLIAILTA